MMLTDSNYPKYDPIYNKKDLIVGSGSSIIVTGWTPKERVAKLIEEKYYAVIGNLYSALYGLTPFFVNLLANPYNWDIFCLTGSKQDELSGSTKCLFDLLSSKENTKGGGFTLANNAIIPNSVYKGRIESIITPEELNLIICSLGKVTLCNSINDLVSLVKLRYQQRFYKKTELTKFSTPVFKTIPTTSSKVLPGAQQGQLIKAKNISESWLKALYLIRTNGYLIGNLQEIMQLTVVITNEPEELEIPDWLSVDRSYVEKYIPQMLEKDNSTTVAYTYGNRIRKFPSKITKDDEGEALIDQLEEISLNLAKDPESKRCWISLWDVSVDKNSLNPPCLTSVWFRIADNKLNLVSTFRSNDVYSAYPANVYALKKMQSLLISLIKKKGYRQKLESGEIIVSLHSAHIYSHSLQVADEVIEKEYKKVFSKTEYSDCVGNFVITTESSDLLVVVQTDLEGKPSNTYQDKDPLKLVRAICRDNPSISRDHSAYLGYELAKASILKDNYIQDKG
jgi:thymidylate synthase